MSDINLTPTINDPILTLIGFLSEKYAQHPPVGTPTEQIGWRTGYQNAISDLVAKYYPGADGGQRGTFAEFAAEHARRASTD